MFDFFMAFIVIQILAATVYCFFGYKFIRILMAFYGFLIGGLLCLAALMLLTSLDVIWMVAISLVVGLLVGGMGFFFYTVGIFFSGGALGYTISGMISAMLGANSTITLIIGIILFIGGGVLAVKLRRPFIVISTAFSGAYSMVLWAGYLMLDKTDKAVNAVVSLKELPQYATTAINGFIDSNQTFVLVGTLLLGLIGMMVQFMFTAKEKARGRH